MPRTGEVGQATYEAVTKKVASGKSRQDAFNEVAAERGQQAGTVAANYYRVARQQNGGKPRRQGRVRPTTQIEGPSHHTAQRTNADAQSLYLCIEKMVDAAVDRRLQRLLSQ